jgi:CBS domain-containing protein
LQHQRQQTVTQSSLSLEGGGMTKPIHARDIMVTKLITLSPEMKLLKAAKLLIKHKISGAPVVDQSGNLIGVFSEKDVMSALINAVYDEFPSVEVGCYMSRDLRTITEDMDLLTIAQIFQREGLRRLPVVRDQQLVGQISRRDVMKSVVNLLEPAEDHKTAILYLSALRPSNETPLE